MTSNLLLIALCLLGLGIALPALSCLVRRPPRVGDPAPGFSLPDAAGTPHALADYRGRWLALVFYPRDDTPHCTREVCALRDTRDEFAQHGLVVLGVSVDTPARHAKFAAKHQLGFTLLADTRGAVAAAYGSLMRVGFLRFARRHSFLIAPDGRVAARYLKVDPATHAATLLADLQDLQAERHSPAD
jgi:peroxiredoxin Q/BCP